MEAVMEKFIPAICLCLNSSLILLSILYFVSSFDGSLGMESLEALW